MRLFIGIQIHSFGKKVKVIMSGCLIKYYLAFKEAKNVSHNEKKKIKKSVTERGVLMLHTDVRM